MPYCSGYYRHMFILMQRHPQCQFSGIGFRISCYASVGKEYVIRSSGNGFYVDISHVRVVTNQNKNARLSVLPVIDDARSADVTTSLIEALRQAHPLKPYQGQC